MNHTLAPMASDAADRGNGRLLIVDDDPVAGGMLAHMLKKHGYEVKVVATGEACLALIDDFVPEVILLDIEMGMGIDGYETCHRVRSRFERAKLTIIFLSSHDTLEERLHAYDVGGDDFVSKPFEAEEIRRKIAVAVAARVRRQNLVAEKTSLEETADLAMRGYSEMGAVLKFTCGALKCRTLEKLAELVIASMRSTQSECHVQLRGSAAAGTLTQTPQGPATALEESVLERMKSQDRVFQFKSRMIVNYETVSLLITNMPSDDEAKAGRIRDYAAIIAESAQDAVANISLRADAVARAMELRRLAEIGGSGVKALQEKHRTQRTDTQRVLEQMVDRVEGMYYRFGLSDTQEAAVSDVVRSTRDEVFGLFERFGSDFDDQLTAILGGLDLASTYQIDMEETAAVADELWD